MKIFVICPVRNLTEEESYIIKSHIIKLEKKGIKVHYPPRDTNQVDSIGFRICTDNMVAIELADEIHVFWNGKSKGSMFDLGMAFALGKKIKLINKLKSTECKSFENVLLELSRISK